MMDAYGEPRQLLFRLPVACVFVYTEVNTLKTLSQNSLQFPIFSFLRATKKPTPYSTYRVGYVYFSQNPKIGIAIMF